MDGTQRDKELLKLFLRCTPAENSGENIYKYTCRKFSIKYGDSAEVMIPSLEGWSYIFGNSPGGYDHNGQVFGIDHNKFENLKDNHELPVRLVTAYWVYNSSIDFHAFCNVFA